MHCLFVSHFFTNRVINVKNLLPDAVVSSSTVAALSKNLSLTMSHPSNMQYLVLPWFIFKKIYFGASMRNP